MITFEPRKSGKSEVFNKYLELAVLNAGFYNTNTAIVCNKINEKTKNYIEQYIDLTGFKDRLKVTEWYKTPENTKGSINPSKEKEFIGYLIENTNQD